MPEAFTMKAKSAGTCVVCNKQYAQGDTLHMQNIGTEEAKNWLASPHEECFHKIQAEPSLMKKVKPGGGFTPRPKRTNEERFNDAKLMMDKLIPLAIERANLIIPPPTIPASATQSAQTTITSIDKASLSEYLRRWDICWQVIFKGLVEEYTR